MKPAATSCVKLHGGVPTLFVDDQPVVPNAYITYLTGNNRYADFAGKGFRLFSMPVFFSTHTFSETSRLQTFSPGIFDVPEGDFSHFDKEVEDIVSVCPDAAIFPRVNLTLSPAWEEAHPDELADEPCDASPLSKRRVCFSSDLWAEETCRLITLFIQHIQAAPYARNIVGYQVAGGNTDEWFSFDHKGSIGKRSREKFALYCEENQLEGTEGEYYNFLSYITAKRIAQFAACIKDLTDHQQVVGTFYGYTLSQSRTIVSHALKLLLEGDEIDFFCCPPCYIQNRLPDHDHTYTVPVDSVKLHGKLFFAENDVRTHLSRAVNDMPHYNKPIWFGPDQETSFEVMRMHLSRALTHGSASWWFDMWGGWYADEGYMKLIGDLFGVVKQSLDKPRQSAAEVALFIDEGAYAYLPQGTALNDIIQRLSSSGVVYDYYLASDFKAAAERYKAVIVLCPYPTDTLKKAAAACAARGASALVLHEGDELPTTQQLRDFCARAGAHLYVDTDAIVYASRSHLFVHALQEGPIALHMPDGETVCDAITGEAVAVPLELKAEHGCLMEIIR